jgi:thioredoxin-related protein
MHTGDDAATGACLRGTHEYMKSALLTFSVVSGKFDAIKGTRKYSMQFAKVSYKQFVQSGLPVMLMWLFAVQPVYAEAPEGYTFLNLTSALEEAKKENRPMFLYFGRYGCSICRKMHHEVFSDPEVMNNYKNRFVLAYVDTESGNRIKMPNGERTTEMQFAARNRILGTPTFIYFAKDQKPLFKKAGFQTIQQMNKYSDYVASGQYQHIKLKDYQLAQ